MYEIIISLIALALSSIFNSEMDTIIEFRNVYRVDYDFDKTWNKVKRKPWIKSKWWCLYQKPLHPLLAIIADGWHVSKGIRVALLLIPIVFLVLNYFNLTFYWFFVIEFGLVLFQGIWFELFYTN